VRELRENAEFRARVLLFLHAAIKRFCSSSVRVRSTLLHTLSASTSGYYSAWIKERQRKLDEVPGKFCTSGDETNWRGEGLSSTHFHTYPAGKF
jgi:hypothetical protein